MPKESHISRRAHWRLLANTIEPSVRGGLAWASQKQLNRSRCRLRAHSYGPNEPLLDGVHIVATW